MKPLSKIVRPKLVGYCSRPRLEQRLEHSETRRALAGMIEASAL